MKKILNLFKEKDKLQHILIVLIIFQLSFIISNKFLNIIFSLLLSLSLSCIAIFGKEIYDRYSKKGVYDKEDIYAGFMGIIITIIEIIIYII